MVGFKILARVGEETPEEYPSVARRKYLMVQHVTYGSISVTDSVINRVRVSPGPLVPSAPLRVAYA